MSRALPVVVVLAAAAGVAWFVFRPSELQSVVVEERDEAATPAGEARPGELAAGPASARKDRTTASRATGGAQLSGLVRRGGVPAAAQVEAHWLMAVDANPFSRRKSGYFQRLLEAPPSERDAAGSARAGDDGRYAVDGLAAGLYEVRARADDGARGAAIASIAADGARVEVNVEVEGGGEVLAGRVVHADGTPWAGVVLVEPGNGSMKSGFPGLGGSSVATRADATGAFEATGLRAGEVTVTAIEPGVFRATSVGVTVPSATPFVLTLDAAMTVLKGKVVADADGSPIAGAAVAGGGQGAGFSLFVAQTTSGADGSFELRVPVGPQSGVMVTADGYAPGMWQGRGAKEGEPVEVRLAKSARVVGRVTRAGSEPVAGASVRAVALGDRNFMSGSEPALSGPDGRYELADVPPGDVMVVAEAKGLVTKGVADVTGQGYNPLATSVKAGETTTVDVEMVAGATVTGTVTDAAGAPVRGAVVQASGGNLPAAFRMDGSSGGATAVTGADGAFVVDPLVPGKAYTLFADCAGFARCKSEVVTVAEATPAVVALRFAPVRNAEISVLDDATGTGVAGARVTAQGATGRRGGFVGAPPTWVTGADGRTRIGPLEAGDLRIDVTADDYVRSTGGESTSTLAEGAATLVVRVKRGLPIAGRILMPDAGPAVGASVHLEWESGRGWVQPVTTGVDGTFRLRGVLAGSARLVANLGKDGKSYAGRATVTVGAEDVAITLAESGKGASGSKDAGSLVVRVLDPDGKPVPSANARLTSGGGSNGTNVSDGKVTFTIDGRPGGTLEIWGAKSRAGTLLNLAPVKRDVGAGETELEIRLVAGVSIEGTVRGPDGAGLRGVQVTATPGPRAANEDSYDRGGWSSHGTARTDAAGAFRIDGLAVEDYTLSVQAPAEFTRYEGPPVRGGTTGVVVALKTGLAAVVTVVDDAGKAIVGAHVSVNEMLSDDGGKRTRGAGRASATTDAAGLARVAGLAPGGVFQLNVNAADAIAWSQSPWAPADTVVHLERAFSLAGIVEDRSGKPVARANVQWSKDKSRWSGTPSGAEGRFKIQGLPAGEVYVRASIGWSHVPAPGAAADADKDVLRVRAGAKDLVLVVDVGLTLTVRFENWPADAPTWQRPQLAIEGATSRPFDGNPVDQVSADGLVTYRGLRDDETYRLGVSLPGGLCAVATGLKAGGESRLRLVPGKTLTGRLTLPPGAENVGVQVHAYGMWVQGKVEADGRYAIEGLPDGSFDVTAMCQKDDVWWQATGKAPAGGTLDLEPKKR